MFACRQFLLALPAIAFSAAFAATPIPPTVKKTVVFMHTSPDGKTLSPQGTGFLVGVGLPEQKDRWATYLVTARHVLEDENGSPLERIWIRFNLRKGGSLTQPFPLSGQTRVYFHPTDKDVDLAVFPIGLNEETVDFLFLPEAMLVSKSEFKELAITEGADIFFTGLFQHYMGYSRIIPIVRFGKIALLTEERVPWREKGKAPQLLNLYLVEALSYGGNSGSPVFLYLGSDSVAGAIRVGPPQIKLIGIVKGYYNEAAEIGIAQQNAPKPFAAVNSGISGVVPAYLLHEILYSDDLGKQRSGAGRSK